MLLSTCSEISSLCVILYRTLNLIVTLFTNPSVILFDSSTFRVLIVLILFCIIIDVLSVPRVVLGCTGFVVSYQLYYKLGARNTGEYSFGMLNTKSFHIHHWIYCLVILVVVGTDYPFIVGLCFGGIAHGIQFSDWNKVIM